MALNTLKCNHLMPLRFKGLICHRSYNLYMLHYLKWPTKIFQCHWSVTSHTAFCRIVYCLGPTCLCSINPVFTCLSTKTGLTMSQRSVPCSRQTTHDSLGYSYAPDRGRDRIEIWHRGSLGDEDDARMSNTCIAQRKRAIPHSTMHMCKWTKLSF